MKEIYLLANAHIDPVWQWGLDEGIAVALATFRSAANLLEANKDFVFNHNEALLYRWVKEYEPSLYERIKKLVAQGRWHIMGGFELQPDCIMPSGEAMVRQILSGRTFFEEEFGVRPTVAVSMDAFGHSQGMVQLLKKSGYEGYLFMRAPAGTPEDFIWCGYDGSRVIAHRLASPYGTLLGHAKEQLLDFAASRDERTELFTWGVGNHGGGPSQQDIDDLNGVTEVKVHHATPEAFFETVKGRAEALPTVEKSIMPVFPGCYTSVGEIKRANRKLENALIKAEKMASLAAMSGILDYPKAELNEAWRTLHFLEFHDVLPGTSTAPVVKRMMERAGHGLEIAQSLVSRAFFRLSECESLPRPGEIPVLVFNPHPYPVRQIVECEFNLPDQNWDEEALTLATVRAGDRELPTQMRKEDSTIPLDWRKRVAFEAELAPLSMNRFEIVLHETRAKEPEQSLTMDNGELYARVSLETGLVESFRYRGQELTGTGLGEILIYEDVPDPWHMHSNTVGKHPTPMPMVGKPRVVADGDVLKEIRVDFGVPGARAEVSYTMPRHGAQLGIRVRLENQLRTRAFRLRIPFMDTEAACVGETLFGRETAFSDGTENASQRYDILCGKEIALGVINDGIYGGCYRDGCLEKTLLRSPVHCAHPLEGRQLIREGVTYEYTGIGQYDTNLVLMPVEKGNTCEIARRAEIENELVVSVSCFPSGACGLRPVTAAVEGDVLLTALKQAEDGGGYIARLFEPVGQEAPFTLTVGDATVQGSLSPFEVRTYRLKEGRFEACELLA